MQKILDFLLWLRDRLGDLHLFWWLWSAMNGVGARAISTALHAPDWAIFLSVLIAVFIVPAIVIAYGAMHSIRNRHAEQILWNLTNFRGEGRDLQRRCEDSRENAQQLHDEFLAWEQRTSVYIRANLGIPANGHFVDDNGIPEPRNHSFPSQHHAQVQFWLYLRMYRLGELINEPTRFISI